MTVSSSTSIGNKLSYSFEAMLSKTHADLDAHTDCTWTCRHREPYNLKNYRLLFMAIIHIYYGDAVVATTTATIIHKYNTLNN